MVMYDFEKAVLPETILKFIPRLYGNPKVSLPYANRIRMEPFSNQII